MKRIMFVVLIIIVFTLNIYSQSTLDVGKDKVAKVNNKIITLKELESKYGQISKIYPNQYSKKEVLDMMITNELFKNELRSDKSLVLDRNQFNSLLDNIKKQYYQAMLNTDPKYQFTEEKFKYYIENEVKIPYEKFIEQIEDQVLMQQYIQRKSRNKLEKIASKKYSSNSDFPVYMPNLMGQVKKYNSLETFYDENINTFVMHESVELKHIFLPTVTQDGHAKLSNDDIKRQKSKIDDVYKRLSAGEPFDKLCELFSEDVDSVQRKNPKTGKIDPGYLGVLEKNNEVMKDRLGDNIFNELFKLSKGKFSSILESKVGYHIFYVVDKQPKRILSFEEAKPGIIDMFKRVEQMQIIEETMQTTLEDLKKKASIVYYKDEYK